MRPSTKPVDERFHAFVMDAGQFVFPVLRDLSNRKVGWHRNQDGTMKLPPAFARFACNRA
jgi:hypothetical protein